MSYHCKLHDFLNFLFCQNLQREEAIYFLNLNDGIFGHFSLLLQVRRDEAPLLIIARKVALVEVIVWPVRVTVVHSPLVEMVGKIEAWKTDVSLLKVSELEKVNLELRKWHHIMLELCERKKMTLRSELTDLWSRRRSTQSRWDGAILSLKNRRLSCLGRLKYFLHVRRCGYAKINPCG